jgi:4-amino-4-deoxychorismate lyase
VSELLGSWIDGDAATLVPLDDRGLQYGDGLFETIRIRNGHARFLDTHLARLTTGCLRLAIPFRAMDALREEIAALGQRSPASAVLKIIVTRGSSPRRGYSPAGAGRPRRLTSLFATPTSSLEGGVDVRVATLTVGETPALAGIKHLNRLDSVLATAEPAHETVFESLLRTVGGDLVGGTMSNVFIVRAGHVSTPAIDRSGVAGVMRAIVLRECARIGIGASESRITVADLFGADEVFITNARVGVVPVRRVGEHRCPMDTIAQRLRAHIEALDA